MNKKYGVKGLILVLVLATVLISGCIGGVEYNLNDSDNRTDRVGAHDFKIPAGYDRTDAKKTDDGTDWFFYEDSKTNYRFSINEASGSLRGDFGASLLASDFASQSNTNYVEVNLNGVDYKTTAYKVYMSNLDHSIYAYVMDIDGKIYCISVDSRISNPDDFVANMI